jgi:hypothetical protein
MLPVIPVGYIVALLAGALVVAGICIAIRNTRAASQQQSAREAAHAEIMRRALAKGRSVAHPETGNIWRQHNRAPLDDTIWKMQGHALWPGGSNKGGTDWTLAWRIAFRVANEDSEGAPIVWVRDTVQGQLLSWRCTSIKTDQQAFIVTHRINRYDKKPDEIFSESDGPLWRRWRLQAKDAELARRVFNAELCELLAKLPVQRASHSRMDERTVISLGPDGLQADLGVEELTPELVDLWVGVGEGLINPMQRKVMNTAPF